MCTGANGLANPRDFRSPVAWYEDREVDYEVCMYSVFLSNCDKFIAYFGRIKKYKTVFFLHDLFQICLVFCLMLL